MGERSGSKDADLLRELVKVPLNKIHMKLNISMRLKREKASEISCICNSLHSLSDCQQAK